MALCAQLSDLEVVVKHAQAEQAKQTKRLLHDAITRIKTQMCQEALGLNVRNMAKVLGVSPRTVYNWNEENVYFPRFFGKLTALILVIMAKSSLPTE